MEKQNELTKINIIIDKQCNQKCKYCEHPHNVYPVRSDDEIYQAFDSVMTKLEELFGKYSFRPQLQGGEPTIMSDKLIDRICNRLSGYPEVLVFSNGYNRNSRFYTEKGYKVVTHIIDWYNFDISQFPILSNETLAFCITHDEICRVEGLISTAPKDTKLLLLPCWSDNPIWNCTLEDKIYLSDLQDKIDGVTKDQYQDKSEKDLCASMRIPLVDCTKQTITPCGFVPKEKNISTCTLEELEDNICKKIYSKITEDKKLKGAKFDLETYTPEWVKEFRDIEWDWNEFKKNRFKDDCKNIREGINSIRPLSRFNTCGGISAVLNSWQNEWKEFAEYLGYVINKRGFAVCPDNYWD